MPIRVMPGPIDAAEGLRHAIRPHRGGRTTRSAGYRAGSGQLPPSDPLRITRIMPRALGESEKNVSVDRCERASAMRVIVGTDSHGD